MKPIWLFLATAMVLHQSGFACIWDADTLAQEKASSPKMAEAILGKPPQLEDPVKLRARIASLEANRMENHPAWWNDLAGAHIRLGEPQKAATLLESVVKRFPDDYGIHANLGTAYHLLGRYADAEKEIARDLEINPDAHFGLEKYHLALLQYLSKDDAYKKTHVYVDEFTVDFLHNEDVWREGQDHPMFRAFPMSVLDDSPPLPKKFDPAQATNGYPAYRLKWDLANDTNRENGVLYMASLNPREPACFVMLGVACLEPSVGPSQDLNLAVAAFQKAIELGSPQADILRKRIEFIKRYIKKAQDFEGQPTPGSPPPLPKSTPLPSSPSSTPKLLILGLATAAAITVALWWGITRQRRTP
jgi:tetratricopeptide (TPR) repeat protein